MRRLILMRHAKSDWSQAGTGDHDRTLNARGKRSAAAMGDWLREHDYLPGEVLCSSATRTRETLQQLNMSPEAPIRFDRGLYLAEAEKMLNILRGATERTVLMLGHNGGISEMAWRLVVDPPKHNRFDDYPTCATLVCDFEVEDWSKVDWESGTARGFVTPHDLAAN